VPHAECLLGLIRIGFFASYRQRWSVLDSLASGVQFGAELNAMWARGIDFFFFLPTAGVDVVYVTCVVSCAHKLQ
jgi:hypothetical protein